MSVFEQVMFGVGVLSIGASGLVLVVCALWAFLCDTAHTRLIVAGQCDRLSDRCQESDRRERIAGVEVDWDRELAELLESERGA